MSKEKIYLILEIGYEYNDEYYHTGNYGETFEKPSMYFDDVDLAIAEKNKKECNAFRGNQIGLYAEDLNEFLNSGTNDTDVIDYMNATWNLGADVNDWWDISVPEKATDEEIKGLMKLISLRFFELVELPKNN